MKLSIIIPVLNSHEVVRRQLLHFSRFVWHGDTELIIVDDGSKPPLEKTVETPGLPVTIHHTNDFRPWTQPFAKNAGARIAKGEYLLFYDVDHIAPPFLINFVREATDLKVQFVREFGVLDEDGRLTQDRDVLAEYGLPKEKGLRIGPLSSNFAMRRDVFWKLGGFEEIEGKPYPQREETAFRMAWRRFDPMGEKLCVHRPKILMFPIGRFVGDADADPKGLFHTLSRKTDRNGFWRQQQRESGGIGN